MSNVIFVLDFNAQEVKSTGFASVEEATAFEAQGGFERIIASDSMELAGLDNPTLLKYYNLGTATQITKIKDRDDAFNAVWARLTGQPAPEKDLNLVPDETTSSVVTGDTPEVEKPKRVRRPTVRKSAVKEPVANEGNTAQVEKESEVAKGKTDKEKAAAAKAKEKAAAAKIKEKAAAAKAKEKAAAAKAKEKAAAAKVKEKATAAKGKRKESTLPKKPRGEKTMEIRRLLLRKNGVTRAEILTATGWPTVSVQAISKNLNLKLTKKKEKGSATQYFGKE